MNIIFCRECGNPIKNDESLDQIYCNKCGAKNDAKFSALRCKLCGRSFGDAAYIFCPLCGTTLIANPVILDSWDYNTSNAICSCGNHIHFDEGVFRIVCDSCGKSNSRTHYPSHIFEVVITQSAIDFSRSFRILLKKSRSFDITEAGRYQFILTNAIYDLSIDIGGMNCYDNRFTTFENKRLEVKYNNSNNTIVTELQTLYLY